MARTYWLDLFTVESWKEFQGHGSDVTGFSEKRWTTVQKIKPGPVYRRSTKYLRSAAACRILAACRI